MVRLLPGKVTGGLSIPTIATQGNEAGLNTSQEEQPSTTIVLDAVDSVIELVDPMSSSTPTSSFLVGNVEWSNPNRPNEGEAVFSFYGEKEGYTMRVRYKNGKKNGIATVYYPDGIVYMNLHYVDDVGEGNYLIRNEKGNVIEEGTLVDGKQCGLVKANGESYHYCDGYQLSESGELSGYWEMKKKNELVRVAQMDDDLLVLNGKSYEVEDGVITREIEYENGKMTQVLREWNDGVMVEYDDNGEKKFEGGFENRLENEMRRKGYGKVIVKNAVVYGGYWKDGEMIWVDQYRNGEVGERLFKNEELSGYWDVKSENGKLVSTSQYNASFSEKEGTCYEYEDGKLKEKSIYHGNEKIRTLIEWKNGKMIEYYENGKRSYEGEWKGSISDGFLRQGEGSEFGVDGLGVVYKGHWRNGVKQGNGSFFRNRNGLPTYSGNWDDGYPSGKGCLKDENGEDLYSGEWEYGYLNVRGYRWIDYKDGKVTWTRDKRRLKYWVVRGGEKPPSCGEVTGKWVVRSLWVLLYVAAGALCIAVAASLLYPLFMFTKILAQYGRWSYLWPIWFLVLGFSLSLYWDNKSYMDQNDGEMVYFVFNSFVNAISIASLHWLPYTIPTWKHCNSGALAISLSLVWFGSICYLIIYCAICNDRLHNALYNLLHLFPVFGVLAVTVVEQENSYYCLIWGSAFLCNSLICAIVCSKEKPIIWLAGLWDCILMLTMTVLVLRSRLVEMGLMVLWVGIGFSVVSAFQCY